MPKIFTEEKRHIIRKQLRTAGLELFGRYGLFHTTVDMLVNACMIAKGSFYSFYPSKEMLYLDCLETISDRIGREYTLPLLSDASTPDISLRNLLEATISLPGTFPILEDLHTPRTKAALQAVIGQSGHSKQSLSVGHDWAVITRYWQERGYSLDIIPGRLHAMEQALLLLAVHGEFARVREGVELIIEMVAIGSAGFVSYRQ